VGPALAAKPLLTLVIDACNWLTNQRYAGQHRWAYLSASWLGDCEAQSAIKGGCDEASSM
jgi:hypothetical protein